MKHFSGAKLKQARLNKNWSISDLHYFLIKSSLRISLQSLRNWENGVAIPSCNHLVGLAEVLEKEEGYFFD